jgi:hypothetical protein
VVRFLGERITYVGRTETERKPYHYRLTLSVTWKELSKNPYGLVVRSVEQTEIPGGVFPASQEPRKTP